MNTELPAESMTVRFVRASGPGGQNVNKVSTAVELRFDPAAAGIEGERLQRLRRIAGRRMTAEGDIVVQASGHRTQGRNRAEAVARLERMVAESGEAPKRRRQTAVPAGAKARRLEDKRRRGDLKRSRRADSC